MKNSFTLPQLVAATASSLVLPPAFAYACVNKRWRSSLRERFAGGAWQEDIRRLDSPVWFHGASVGEASGLKPLLEAFRQRFPQQHVVTTSTSITGRSALKEQGLSDASALLPFDHPLFVERALSAIRPRMLVISETEIWPNLLFALARHDVPVVLVNGRISDYSLVNYQRIRWLIEPTLKSMRRLLVQTEIDASRFRSLGAPTEQLSVVGSTKYDHPEPTWTSGEAESFAQSLGLDAGKPCFVAGSVRPGEFEQVIDAYAEVLPGMPELQFVLAPRHPEYFDDVAACLEMKSIAFHRRSAGVPSEPARVVLLDTLGELRQVYGLASFSFVGGTLVDIGGHNPLEPASYRTPVIVGPHVGNVRDAISALKQAGAHLQVENASDLAQVIQQLSADPASCKAKGEMAYRVWQQNAGATARTLAELELFLSCDKSAGHSALCGSE